jgi:predicted O-methyltransferase YrrM
MEDELVSETVAALVREIGPEQDTVLRKMEKQVQAEEFPAVGPEVGGWFALLTRIIEADRVFEFGSGFGYSAYWIARALPEDGEIVLTEIDADELEQAREYFEQGRLTDCAHFEQGDAIDIVEMYDGPFDIVHIDNEDTRYIEAFEAVRNKLKSGSLVVADNTIHAEPVIDARDVLSLVRGEDAPEATEASVGIAEYLAHIRSLDSFTTALLPLGDGVAVSVRQ